LAKVLGLRQVDLMKVDVEGAELEVLRGSERLLEEGSIARIVVEVHLDIVREKDVRRLLAGFKYRVVGEAPFGGKNILYVESMR